MKRTPMRRGEPMQRTPMKQGPTARLVHARYTFDEVKPLIADRDGSCVRCGKRGEVFHHRVPRGAGGSSRNPEASSPDKIIYLCNADHAWIESWRAAAAHLGYLVPAGIDPEQHPIMWHGQWTTLTAGGTVLFGATPPRLDLG